MRIGVDSRPLGERRTSGIPRYLRSVLDELAGLDTENEYVLYAHRDFEYLLRNPRWKKRVVAKTRFGSVWLQTEVPFWMREDGIDVFWGTQHSLPLLMPSGTRSIVTILDLVHLVHPETMQIKNRAINSLMIPLSVRRADAIVTISNSTLNDVVRFLRPRDKIIKVTHMAASSQFGRRDREQSRSKVSEALELRAPYILTVGTLEPRKNLMGAIRAFARIAQRIPQHLAVVGPLGWKSEPLLAEIQASPARDRIHLLGYVDEEILPELYCGADVFVFPSLYEGFGIPVVEAMASGTPVVASKASCLPEVVGDAAELVDPLCAEGIERGIMRVLSDGLYRERLVRKGMERAKQFQWRDSAEGMIEVFDRLGASSAS